MKIRWISSEKAQEPYLWIFGYGSLIWNPGMDVSESVNGTLHGWSRRFWQGNMTYRGTPNLPGRVVTIVKEAESETQGLLFKVKGVAAIQSALEHLHFREIESGYEYQTVAVSYTDSHDQTMTKMALTCVAKEDNQWYLGPSESDQEMANQIANAKGKAGPNADYLLNLASSMRKFFPGSHDEHLFELERMVLEQL